VSGGSCVTGDATCSPERSGADCKGQNGRGTVQMTFAISPESGQVGEGRGRQWKALVCHVGLGLQRVDPGSLHRGLQSQEMGKVSGIRGGTDLSGSRCSEEGEDECLVVQESGGEGKEAKECLGISRESHYQGSKGSRSSRGSKGTKGFH